MLVFRYCEEQGMGIVSYCPNRHRVKVKDDLAGKKGICPTCGARFRIPLESQPDPATLQDTGPAELEPTANPAPAPVASAIAVPAAQESASPPLASLPGADAPLPPGGFAGLSTTGLPVAEIISLDADLAVSLPRALPLASPASG